MTRTLIDRFCEDCGTPISRRADASSTRCRRCAASARPGNTQRTFGRGTTTCEKCGKPYTDKARGALREFHVCPNCRTTCVTCGKPKKLDLHKQCIYCRKEGKVCQTCGINPIFQNRRECWSCINANGEESARMRDRAYNLTPGQYDQMLEAQGGVCQISSQPETSVSKRTGKTYPLAVDHDRSCCPGDRSCGKCLRGLIRRNLNVALGMFGDDPALLRAAADYIERHRITSQGVRTQLRRSDNDR